MIGAGLCAEAAFDALLLIDMCLLLPVEIDGVALAGALAAVRKASTADRRYIIARNRALVAGDIQRLYDIWIVAVAAHREFDALAEDGALLIDAAAHGGLFARHDGLWDIQKSLLQCVVKCALCHLA